MTYRANDLYIGRSFDLYGEFSEGEVELFAKLVRPGQTVLDVGANIGAHTVPLAKLVGRGGRVLAFEPQRTVYYLLCGNVAQNNLEIIVHCHQAAVGERAGRIAVPELDPDAPQNFGGLALSSAPESPAADSAPVVRIDELGLTACDFIKIDVEGMEREALAGASETIRRFRPLLYIEDDRPDKSPALRALLESLGYAFYFHAPLLFRPDNFLACGENVFPNIASHNLYAHYAESASPIQPEAFGMQRLGGPLANAAGPPRAAPQGAVVAPMVGGPANSAAPAAAARGSSAAQSRLNFGLALYEQGRYEEALSAYREALEIEPDFAEAHCNIGLVRAAQGRQDEAVAAYRRAIALKPEFPEAYNNLGLAMRQLGRTDEALAHCREAARLQPQLAAAQNNLGSVLQEAGRFEEAIESLASALRLDPRYAHAHNNLGICLWRLGRYGEAVASYRRAIELSPDAAEFHNNLASALRDQGELEQALACYGRAIELKSDYPAPRWNQSLIWLLQGDFARGWPEYEWRWKLSTFQRRPCPQPIWDGSPLDGKTILLAAEQGLGDTLQFLRYAPLVKARAARVIVEVHRPLRRLAKTCSGIDKVIVQGDSPPPFDTYVTLMSLPWALGASVKGFPADVPYLAADATLVEQWRDEIASLPGLKIGIAWKGSPQNGMDRERSLPLELFEGLARLPGVTLVSLQKGVGGDQVADVADRFSVVDFGRRLDETSGPFMDTAAIVRHLDLVITCDSALAHLAGALGAPVWLALTKTPDWRWLLDRDDSPWYPTMRLFRQRKRGDWPDVFSRITEALRELSQR